MVTLSPFYVLKKALLAQNKVQNTDLIETSNHSVSPYEEEGVGEENGGKEEVRN